MRITLVHNPKSGKQTTPKRELLDLLGAAGHEITYQATRERRWQQTLEEPADMVVVAGGDGTIAKVLKHLPGRHVPVAILPTGTSNNIATSLGLTGAPRDLVARWGSSRITPFDLGVVSVAGDDFAFAEAFGLGMFARFLKMSANRAADGEPMTDKPSGKPRVGVPLMLEALEKTSGHECTLTLDGIDVSGDYLMIEVMNIRAIGGKLAFAPDADPGDGMFDVVTVRTSERAALVEFLRAHAAGEEQAPLPCVRARSMELVCKGSQLHLDDKRWPKGGKKRCRDAASGLAAITVRVQPGAAEVLL